MNTATLNTVSTVPAPPTHSLSSALHRACVAAQTAADNKGRDILVLDMRSCTPLFDYFVISHRHEPTPDPHAGRGDRRRACEPRATTASGSRATKRVSGSCRTTGTS